MSRRLDNYHGRPVKKVTGENGNWVIVLEGDVQFHSTDESLIKPDALPNGAILVTSDLEIANPTLFFQLRDQQGNIVSESPVSFNKDAYEIFDPSVNEGERFIPSSGVVDPETPPEPEGRVVDGPEAPLEEASGNAKAESKQGKSKITTTKKKSK